jgi:HAD superfamily hydrolase (TIGR01484 family)
MGLYKLIALDMDGTVLSEKQKISAENKKWIERAKDAGITVIFSTGRERRSALPYAEELDLQTPMVTVNGSEVWKNPNELLSRHLMDAVWVEKMHQMAVDYDIWFWATAAEEIFNRDNWQPDLETKHWLKFGYFSENDEKRQEIQRTIAAWDVMEITNSHPHNIECNPKGVNKASGIQEVCSLLGIRMSEVVAIGDSLNDAAMIRSAGLGVAMGNAQDEVKGLADLITTTNDEDGVAKVISEYVLK